MRKWSVLAIPVGVACLIGVAPARAQKLTAAGASFPDPIYERWFQEYNKLHPSVQINYQPAGSGAGIKQLTEGTVDFGASDMPMKDSQIAAMKIKPLHFPTVLGGVVITYNLPGVTQDLKFTPDVIAGIFMGKITSWTDPAIARENPGVKIPKLDIIVVHRSDGSGTNFVFTDYLSKVSPEWKSKIGADTSVKWPTGTGAAQNAGVAGAVKQNEGSIGYVELIYALQQKMPYAWVKNSAGTFLKPTLETVTAAAAGAAKDMPADFRVSITDAPGKNAYPISTFTYLLIPSEIKDTAKKNAIVGFLKWMLTSGEKDVADHPDLGYAPLPKSVLDKETKQIALIH
jgi:phosphate transport system substrate-binding protein